MVMKPITFFGLLAAFLLSFASSADAQGSYQVQEGDVLVIEVLEDPALNRSTVVLPDGNFSFPFAGTLPARGRTVSQIESSIRSAIASNFASPPTVFVSIEPFERDEDEEEELETINIYVLGEVNSPGLVELEPGSTILQAIAVSGGPSRFAATKRFQLRRTDRSGRQNVTVINYKALSQGAALSRDIVLRDGDVILVPERRLFE